MSGKGWHVVDGGACFDVLVPQAWHHTQASMVTSMNTPKVQGLAQASRVKKPSTPLEPVTRGKASWARSAVSACVRSGAAAAPGADTDQRGGWVAP